MRPMRDTFEIDDVYVKKLYEGPFKEKMLPQVYKTIYDFLCSDEVRKQINSIVKSDEVWIKPNLGNARPPETGCISHPVTVKALMDSLLNFYNFKNPIKLVETITYHKGPGIPEILARIPQDERVKIEDKLKHKDPSQDIHDFCFNLLLELSGIKKLVEDYQGKGLSVEVLNLSKEPVMGLEERKEIIYKLERLLGEETIPINKVRRKILDNIPRVLREKRIGLISLAIPKTHDEPEVWATATMKNIGVGLVGGYQHKGFMHKDLSKAIVYNYALWKIGCENRVFGIASGPYGMEGEGPIFGRAADFPYIIAGSDLLKIDCVTTVLMFGKIDLVNRLKPFKYAHNRVGLVPSARDLEKLVPYALNYESHPYPLKP